MEALHVIWRGETVGRLEDAVPDMWYLEGQFVSDDSDASVAFAHRASKLNAKAVFSDLCQGLLASIAPTDGSGDETTVIILSLSDDVLFLRRVIDKNAISWAQANVPE